jgi:hypothetical protein
MPFKNCFPFCPCCGPQKTGYEAIDYETSRPLLAVTDVTDAETKLTKLLSNETFEGWTKTVGENGEFFTSPHGLKFYPTSLEVEFPAHPHAKNLRWYVGAFVLNIPAAFSGFPGGFKAGGWPGAIGSMMATGTLNYYGMARLINKLTAPKTGLSLNDGQERNSSELRKKYLLFALFISIPGAVLAGQGTGQAFNSLLSGNGLLALQVLFGTINEGFSTSLTYENIAHHFWEAFREYYEYAKHKSRSEQVFLWTSFVILAFIGLLPAIGRVYPTYELLDKIPDTSGSDFGEGLANILRYIFNYGTALCTGFAAFAMFCGSLLKFYISILKFAADAWAGNVNYRELFCPTKVGLVTLLLIGYCASSAYQNCRGLLMTAGEVLVEPHVSAGITTDLCQVVYHLSGVAGAANFLNRFGTIRTGIAWAATKWRQHQEGRLLQRIANVARSIPSQPEGWLSSRIDSFITRK